MFLLSSLDHWETINSRQEPTYRTLYINSVHRPEIEIGGTLANFSTVIGPFFDRFAEVVPNEGARVRILDCRLGELVYERNTGEGSLHVLPAGSVTLQSRKLIRSVPKNSFSTSAPAPPSIE